MSAWLTAFACGLGAGIVSAWGVGGGTLLLVLLTLVLHVEQRTAQGINLLFFLPTAAAALLSHARAGRLDRPTLRADQPLRENFARRFRESRRSGRVRISSRI